VLQAIRDAESRTMFCGYNPLPYKLSIWVISAMMCGVAGALYVPQVGIINPSEMGTVNSIEMAIWAAVGGRATLVGPILGAFVVNGGKSWLTVAAPEYWLFVLGALFIVVTLFMPSGIVGMLRERRDRRRQAQLLADVQADATAAQAARAESLRQEETGTLEGARA
jgi:urea transport system permease protein